MTEPERKRCQLTAGEVQSWLKSFIAEVEEYKPQQLVYWEQAAGLVREFALMDAGTDPERLLVDRDGRDIAYLYMAPPGGIGISVADPRTPSGFMAIIFSVAVALPVQEVISIEPDSPAPDPW